MAQMSSCEILSIGDRRQPRAHRPFGLLIYVGFQIHFEAEVAKTV